MFFRRCANLGGCPAPSLPHPHLLIRYPAPAVPSLSPPTRYPALVVLSPFPPAQSIYLFLSLVDLRASPFPILLSPAPAVPFPTPTPLIPAQWVTKTPSFMTCLVTIRKTLSSPGSGTTTPDPFPPKMVPFSPPASSPILLFSKAPLHRTLELCREPLCFRGYPR